DVVFIVGSPEARPPLVHPAEQPGRGDAVAGLGLVGRETRHCAELDVDEADLRRGGQPSAVVLAGAGEVAQSAHRVTAVCALPCASVEVAARLADRKALLEQLDRALVLPLAQVQAAEVV